MKLSVLKHPYAAAPRAAKQLTNPIAQKRKTVRRPGLADPINNHVPAAADANAVHF